MQGIVRLESLTYGYSLFLEARNGAKMAAKSRPGHADAKETTVRKSLGEMKGLAAKVSADVIRMRRWDTTKPEFLPKIWSYRSLSDPRLACQGCETFWTEFSFPAGQSSFSRVAAKHEHRLIERRFLELIRRDLRIQAQVPEEILAQQLPVARCRINFSFDDNSNGKEVLAIDING